MPLGLRAFRYRPAATVRVGTVVTPSFFRDRSLKRERFACDEEQRTLRPREHFSGHLAKEQLIAGAGVYAHHKEIVTADGDLPEDGLVGGLAGADDTASSIAFWAGFAGNSRCCRSGQIRPSTEGPRRMPAISWPMTAGCPMRYSPRP